MGNKTYSRVLASKLIDLGNLMFAVSIVGTVLRPGDAVRLLFPASVMLGAWGAGLILLSRKTP